MDVFAYFAGADASAKYAKTSKKGRVAAQPYLILSEMLCGRVGQKMILSGLPYNNSIFDGTIGWVIHLYRHFYRFSHRWSTRCRVRESCDWYWQNQAGELRPPSNPPVLVFCW